MIVDRLENWELYSNLPRLTRAFKVLSLPQTFALTEGRYELEGKNIIALPQAYQSKLRQDGRWEAHRRYIDIQYIVSGVELMGWAPVSTLAPAGEFNVAKDVGFFEGQGDFIRVSAGMFAVFFPHDGHMPSIAVGDRPEGVRKIVMKVAM